MSVDDALKRFGRVVVKESKTALTKQGRNVSKELYNSIKSSSKVSKNSFELSFFMADHGKFLDKGVKGKKSSFKAPNSPFQYKDKMPPLKMLDKWVIKKGIAPRNSKGKFVSREGIKFAIAKSIYLTGTPTTNFFTKPFNAAFKNLPNEVTKAYGLDVDKLLANTTI